MAPLHISISGLDITVTAQRLTPDAFAPFGEVVQNPRPDVHPSRFADAGPLPFDAVPANQGSAIKYQHVTTMRNRYDQAPSGVPGVAVMNMFVCASRKLLSHRPGQRGQGRTASTSSFFEVAILERHPYTSQTFAPLSTSADSDLTSRHGYLVIVAPNVGKSSSLNPESPASSPPDLSALKAFTATTDQAVTYGAGTWHAPMVALGPENSAVDFVVTQFANGVGLEDCQEVTFGSSGEGSVYVDVPHTLDSRLSRL